MPTPPPSWSLDDLVAHASAALTGLGIVSADERVRVLPDRRTIRWYQTAGLLQRPSYEGRQARYGQHHLIQVVAIKILQAGGMSLAQIQADLAGASPAQLREIIGAERLAAVLDEPSPPPPPAQPAPAAVRLAPGVLLILDPAVDPSLADPAHVRALTLRLQQAIHSGEEP